MKLGKFLQPKTEAAYTLLRIVIGLLFAFHGMQKMFGYEFPAEYLPKIWSQAWFGGIIELVGGFLVAAGCFTRCAAFVCSGEMAVAYTQFHWRLKLGANFFPAVNKGELALVFCVIFLYIACRGAGALSIDRTIRGEK